MTGLQVTRRTVLGALLALVTAAVLGTGSGASAAPHQDYGSRENMKVTCEVFGGTFIDYGDGNLFCAAPGKTIICDGNGNDCSSAIQEEPDGRWDSHVGTVDKTTTAVSGTEPLAPVDESQPSRDAQPVRETDTELAAPVAEQP